MNPIFIRLFVEAHCRAYQFNLDALARAIHTRAAANSLVVLRLGADTEAPVRAID